MNKRQLYETIMREVSKQVKKAINENAPFYETVNGRKDLYYICTPEEKQYIMDEFATEDAIIDKFDDCFTSVIGFEEPMTLNGMKGTITGTIDFNVETSPAREWYPDGSGYWSGYNVDSYDIRDYDIYFYDEDENEYTVYLSIKDYKNALRDRK